MGTQDGGGRADVSPRGDPPGFVKILDEKTLAIPDRPGNNRLDSLTNILANPTIGLLFIVPGFDDTLRVNGTACLTTDPDILKPMSVNGRTPVLAIPAREGFRHFRMDRISRPEIDEDATFQRRHVPFDDHVRPIRDLSR